MGRRHARRSRVNLGLAAGLALGALAAPGVASAAEGETTSTRRNPNRYVALEAQAVVMREMVPTSFLGFDGALAVGNETFALRVGGALLGSPSFQLASNEISNVLGYGLADVCAGKTASVHRIRFCVGGEVGGWMHRWTGFGRADRRFSSHVAGTLKGDYHYAFTDRLGLLLGVGLTVPAVGPQFRGRDQLGRPSPILVPGPVAGSFRIGTSFRFG